MNSNPSTQESRIERIVNLSAVGTAVLSVGLLYASLWCAPRTQGDAVPSPALLEYALGAAAASAVIRPAYNAFCPRRGSPQ